MGLMTLSCPTNRSCRSHGNISWLEVRSVWISCEFLLTVIYVSVRQSDEQFHAFFIPVFEWIISSEICSSTIFCLMFLTYCKVTSLRWIFWATCFDENHQTLISHSLCPINSIYLTSNPGGISIHQFEFPKTERYFKFLAPPKASIPFPNLNLQHFRNQSCNQVPGKLIFQFPYPLFKYLNGARRWMSLVAEHKARIKKCIWLFYRDTHALT